MSDDDNNDDGVLLFSCTLLLSLPLNFLLLLQENDGYD